MGGDAGRARSARPQAGLRHRQGRRRQDDRGGRAGAAGRRARQAGARLRDRRQGRPAVALRGRADRLRRPRRSRPGVWSMSMDTEASLREYLKLNLRIPVVGRIGPLAKAFDFVATAAPGRARDPHGRQVLLRGPGAPLRPGRGRRAGQRPHRGPAGRAPGDQRPGEGRAHPQPDRLDARHPLRPGPDRARGRHHARGDAGQRDARAGRRGGARRRRSRCRRWW